MIDADSLEDEAVAARKRLENAKQDVKITEDKVKEAQDWLAESKKASEEAEAAAQDATKEGLKKRNEKGSSRIQIWEESEGFAGRCRH